MFQICDLWCAEPSEVRNHEEIPDDELDDFIFGICQICHLGAKDVRTFQNFIK